MCIVGTWLSDFSRNRRGWGHPGERERLTEKCQGGREETTAGIVVVRPGHGCYGHTAQLGVGWAVLRMEHRGRVFRRASCRRWH